MFKSIDRYVIREISGPFAIGLLVYTFTLLIQHLFKWSNLLISKSASGWTILKLFMYLMPFLLSVTLPIATLMGVLAGLSRMSSDSEIIAFKTLGISNTRIMRPVMLFSTASFFFTAILMMYILPAGNYQLYKLFAKIRYSTAISEIKPREFYPQLNPYVIYFNDINSRTSEWKDVFIYSRENGGKDTIILAKSGNLLQGEQGKENHIFLQDARVHTFTKNKPDENYSITSYKYLQRPIQPTRITTTRSHQYLIFPKLVKELRERSHSPPKSEVDRYRLRQLLITFYKKFSIPFSCLALGFLALSMGIFTRKGGNANGFIISIGITFVYYTIEMALDNMAKKGVVSPFLGIWTPNILLLLFGFILYYFVSKEKTVQWEKWGAFFLKIPRKIFAFGSRGENRKTRRSKRIGLVRIIDLYVIRKLFLTFLMIFCSLIFIFYIIEIIELIDDVVQNNIPFFYALKHVFYKTPGLISFIMPISILTAVLIAFSLMSKNNEIVAVNVSGISLYRLCVPAIVMGIVLSFCLFYIQEKVTPDANRQARKYWNIIKKRGQDQEVELKNWVRGPDNEIYFTRINHLTKKYSDFNIIYFDQQMNIKRRISAKYASWKGPHNLHLRNGYERKFQKDTPSDFMTFHEMQLRIHEGRNMFQEKVAYSQFMNIEALNRYIKYLEEKEADTRRYRAEVYQNYAFPFTNLIMVLIAIPFSFMMGKKGTIFGIGIAVGVSMVFWFSMALFQSLGTHAILSPFLSAFGPLFLFAAVSIYLFSNIKT